MLLTELEIPPTAPATPATDCKNFGDKKGDCDRSLTKEVEKEAEKFGLLICSFAERPDCFETKLNTKE